MLPFKKLLFPVDYSDRCRAVIPYVEEMADRFSAQLTMVHAFTNTNWLKQVDDQEKRQMADFIAEAFPDRKVDSFLEEGEPASAIEKVVRHQETDLIMIPTRGLETGLLSSSVTEKVLQKVSAAVWAETGAAAKRRPRNIAYKSILCAVTFNEETEAVLRAAAFLTSSYDAQLSLVHAVDEADFRSDSIDEVHRRLDDWKHRLGIDASDHVLVGKTGSTVCGEAWRQEADLLVVGRGRGEDVLARIWSHLYEIICGSPCPVLSI